MKKALALGCLALAGLMFFYEFTLADADMTPPQLLAFDFEPKAIDAECVPAVTFTARITDDLSGITNKTTEIRFKAPTSNQFVDVLFDEQNRVSGNALDGVYVGTVIWPRFGETGTWGIDRAILRDDIENLRFVPRDQLLAQGFPVDLTVDDSGDCHLIYLPILTK